MGELWEYLGDMATVDLGLVRGLGTAQICLKICVLDHVDVLEKHTLILTLNLTYKVTLRKGFLPLGISSGCKIAD